MPPSASARIRAGGGQWWLASAPGRGTACSTWQPEPAWSPQPLSAAPAARSWGWIRVPRCSRGRRDGSAPTRSSLRAYELVRSEAESLPFADRDFDHLTFTYLLRYLDDPGATLRELARVVKPGGRIASLEFMLPPNRVARSLWRLYTRVGLPTLGRLISRDWQEVGRFLGPSITDLYQRLPLERQLELWRAAGIASVEAKVMSLGGGVVIWGTRGE